MYCILFVDIYPEDGCFCPKAWNYYVFTLILYQYVHYELYSCVGVFFSCNDMAKNTYCST